MKKILLPVLFLLVTSAFGQKGLDILVGKEAALSSKKEVKGQSEQTGLKQDPVYFFLNKKLPHFILKDLNEKTFSSSELIGKPALINLWSIYCSPCILEFPYLDSLKNKYGDKMNFIAIGENSASEIKDLLKRKPFNFYILQEGDSYQKNTLKVGSLPKNIWVDKYGYIRMIQNGLPVQQDPTTGKYFIRNSTPFEEIIKNILGLK
jgi:cytochrome c biogenesis protein CcmG, thiol:disulfide interchange protein DsbE